MANVVVVANQIQLPQEDQLELVRLPRFVLCQITIFDISITYFDRNLRAVHYLIKMFVGIFN